MTAYSFICFAPFFGEQYEERGWGFRIGVTGGRMGGRTVGLKRRTDKTMSSALRYDIKSRTPWMNTRSPTRNMTARKMGLAGVGGDVRPTDKPFAMLRAMNTQPSTAMNTSLNTPPFTVIS
jgi:hypothetical protein